MAKLKTAERNKLPKKDFAGPGKSYPDENKAHARDALSRVSANGSPAVKAEVRRNVEQKYPSIKQKSSAGRKLRMNASDKRR
jgi:hypothetical protein